MHLILLLVLFSLLASSSAVLDQAKSWRQFGVSAGNTATDTDRVSGLERITGDSDFEDDYSDELIKSFGSLERSVHSITHLHRDRGEVLVPCFGMWWPVGPTYDYTSDNDNSNNNNNDDDNKKKKRRRSRRQRKSARMKRKKS